MFIDERRASDSPLAEFLRNHPINGEGGSIPEENRVNYAMDMAAGNEIARQVAEKALRMGPAACHRRSRP